MEACVTPFLWFYHRWRQKSLIFACAGYLGARLVALPACPINPDDFDPQSGPVYSLFTHTLGRLPCKECEDDKLVVIVLTILSNSFCQHSSLGSDTFCARYCRMCFCRISCGSVVQQMHVLNETNDAVQLLRPQGQKRTELIFA